MDNNQEIGKDNNKSEENKAPVVAKHADDPEEGDLRKVF